jgi:hypothetical protein
MPSTQEGGEEDNDGKAQGAGLCGRKDEGLTRVVWPGALGLLRSADLKYSRLEALGVASLNDGPSYRRRMEDMNHF